MAEGIGKMPRLIKKVDSRCEASQNVLQISSPRIIPRMGRGPIALLKALPCHTGKRRK